jgi:hypothetical protein
MHEGRRSAIHEILKNLDYAQHPDKYKVNITQEVSDAGTSSN